MSLMIALALTDCLLRRKCSMSINTRWQISIITSHIHNKHNTKIIYNNSVYANKQYGAQGLLKNHYCTTEIHSYQQRGGAVRHTNARPLWPPRSFTTSSTGPLLPISDFFSFSTQSDSPQRTLAWHPACASAKKLPSQSCVVIEDGRWCGEQLLLVVGMSVFRKNIEHLRRRDSQSWLATSNQLNLIGRLRSARLSK